MNTMFLKMLVKFQDLKSCEEGQDLIEYGLLVALISLAVVATITGVAASLATIFTNISTTLATAV